MIFLEEYIIEVGIKRTLGCCKNQVPQSMDGKSNVKSGHMMAAIEPSVENSVEECSPGEGGSRLICDAAHEHESEA